MNNPTPDSTPDTTYESTKQRFNQEHIAQDYVIKKNLTNNFKNRKEMQCIEDALSGLIDGGQVLDLPCGSGRLEPMLLRKGFIVWAADFSKPMLAAAQDYITEHFANDPTVNLDNVRFEHQDVMQTSYKDNQFDAVICNRLFHHYPEPSVRRKVLQELARITSDRIILSYYSNFALSAFKFHLINRMKGLSPDDRIPIWFNTFKADLDAVGLHCEEEYPVRYGVSPQTYLKLIKK